VKATGKHTAENELRTLKALLELLCHGLVDVEVESHDPIEFSWRLSPLGRERANEVERERAS